MTATLQQHQRIIMNFTVPPGLEDLEAMADNVLELLPEELLEFMDDIELQVEDMPDEALEAELELDDPFDLLALYRSGREISPGVEKKNADGEDMLILFRRPILDYWCESGDDLTNLLRQVMIEELGRHFDFSDAEIEEMTGRHYQGLL